jgi:hypothetical protein
MAFHNGCTRKENKENINYECFYRKRLKTKLAFMSLLATMALPVIMLYLLNDFKIFFLIKRV